MTAPPPTKGALDLPPPVDASAPDGDGPTEGNSPPRITKEFWTARQRRGHSLHEISYRACFKPQLPEFFIEKYTRQGDLVADPFLGRGTTPLQAHLMDRRAAGSDVNPLCVMLARPRFDPPPLREAEARLREILDAGGDVADAAAPEDDLLAFYHPDTLSQLLILRRWFMDREREAGLDRTDDWLRMVCLNRLSGHSPGFFSVRTMPPNQAVSAESQRRINQRQDQTPGPKDIVDIVMRKSRSLLRTEYPSPQLFSGETPAPPMLHTATADHLFYLADGSVDLVVTSPPFLNIVDYRKDNWLRCWFAGVDVNEVQISGFSSVTEWRGFVRNALREMSRVVRAGGHIAFEVGEVRNGEVLLEEQVLQASQGLPLIPKAVLVNQQNFTKTSNLWGVDNNNGGTNTNRVVLFQKADAGVRACRGFGGIRLPAGLPPWPRPGFLPRRSLG